LLAVELRGTNREAAKPQRERGEPRSREAAKERGANRKAAKPQREREKV
jgi:hypothetical protein